VTAAELIEILSKHHPTTQVLITGREEGYREIMVRDVTVVDRGEKYENNWCGRFDDHDNHHYGPVSEPFKAVVIDQC